MRARENEQDATTSALTQTLNEVAATNDIAGYALDSNVTVGQARTGRSAKLYPLLVVRHAHPIIISQVLALCEFIRPPYCTSFV